MKRWIFYLLTRILVGIGVLFILLGMLIAFAIATNEARGDSGVLEDLRRTVYIEVEYLEYQNIEPGPAGFGVLQHELIAYRTKADDPYTLESVGYLMTRAQLGKLARRDHIIFFHFERLWRIDYCAFAETWDTADHDVLFRARKNWYNALSTKQEMRLGDP